MRAEDGKRIGKLQQKARKNRIQEERLRQKYEAQTPLILGEQEPKAPVSDEQA